jgi:uncharacterized protein with beta-barrel porin domain
MFKNFEKIIGKSVALSSIYLASNVLAANFSVDNQLDHGPGSFAGVIKSANAIFPGDKAYNTIIFRESLSLDYIMPQIRQNVIFNVLGDIKINIEQSLESSARFLKTGKGELNLAKGAVVLGPCIVEQGLLELNSRIESDGFIIKGTLLAHSTNDLGSNPIKLEDAGILKVENGYMLANPIENMGNTFIDIVGASIKLSKLLGQGVFTKTGQGLLEIPKADSFIGTIRVKEGDLKITNGFLKCDLKLDGGNLYIDSSRPFQNYNLLLKTGTVQIDRQEALFSNPIELQASHAGIFLKGHNLYLPQGFKGSGIVEIEGPGTCEITQTEPLVGQIYFSNLNLASKLLAPHSAYYFENVNLSLENTETIDANTAVVIERGFLNLNHKNEALRIQSKVLGQGDFHIFGQSTTTASLQVPFPGHWIQHEGFLNLSGDVKNLTVLPQATFQGSGNIDILNISGTYVGSIDQEALAPILNAHQVVLSGDVVLAPQSGDYKKILYPLIKTDISDITHHNLLLPAQFEGKLIQDESGIQFQLDNFHALKDYTKLASIDDQIVAGNLDQMFAPYGSEIDSLIRQLMTLKEEPVKFSNAFQGLQPAYFSALGLVMEYNFILARSALSNRMQELMSFPCAKEYVSEKEYALWLDPVGDFTEQMTRQNDMGYNAATVGGFLGFDGKIHRKFRFGVTAGYTNSRVNWMKNTGKGLINSAYFSSYFLYKPSRFYMNGSATGAYSHYNVDRYININSIKLNAYHKNHGFGFSTDLELGYLIGHKIITQPYLRQSYIGIYQQKFIETGAGDLNLNVDAKQFAMYRIDSGFVFHRCFDYIKWTFVPEITIAGIWEQELKTGSFHATYENTNISYDVVGMKPNRLLFSPGAALTACIKKYPMNLGVRYHAEICPQFYDQRISGHIVYSF